jgi:hypothetical protein
MSGERDEADLCSILCARRITWVGLNGPENSFRSSVSDASPAETLPAAGAVSSLRRMGSTRRAQVRVNKNPMFLKG